MSGGLLILFIWSSFTTNWPIILNLLQVQATSMTVDLGNFTRPIRTPQIAQTLIPHGMSATDLKQAKYKLTFFDATDSCKQLLCILRIIIKIDVLSVPEAFLAAL